jgi:hypothetical protein
MYNKFHKALQAIGMTQDEIKRRGLSAPIPRPPAGRSAGFPLLSLARFSRRKPLFQNSKFDRLENIRISPLKRRGIKGIIKG